MMSIGGVVAIVVVLVVVKINIGINTVLEDGKWRDYHGYTMTMTTV
jgi:hypothetical protein